MILPGVENSFHSLTQRTLKSFKYVQHHMSKFSYILKCDDDSLVDVPRVASELQLRKRRGLFYWGYITGNSPILQWSLKYGEYKWFITDHRYLPYAYGGGYVLSGDLLELLATNEQFLNIYNSEDVAVGSWLAPYNVEYKHDSRFNTESTSRGCKDPFLILHKVSTSDMFYYHDNYKQENRHCSSRTSWHSYHGYIYNWNTKPSDCCYMNVAVP